MFNSILLALDCSPASESVLKSLNSLRMSAKTKVILCHVFPPDNEAVDDPDRPHQFSSDRYEWAKTSLETYQQRIPKSEIEIIAGDPVEEILRLANIYHSDLIIVGTRGLKGVERILNDSVSSQVVAEAPCSVLVINTDR
ncbi:MAG: universal stress protein [Snowella sp.]|nr:universal stress protein [Snowella sp.]